MSSGMPFPSIIEYAKHEQEKRDREVRFFLISLYSYNVSWNHMWSSVQ